MLGRVIFYSVFLLGMVAVTTGLMYNRYQDACALPLTYRVASVDPQFALDRTEATAAVEQAIVTWEEGLGQDVFALNESEADLDINFVFDERQARTNAEIRERELLEAVESQSAEVQAVYQSEITKLEIKEAAYKQAAAAYERDLAAYNQTVAQYNQAGGAPPEVYEELENERERLATQADNLNAKIVAINELVDRINQLGEEGNILISRFNEKVDDFNQNYADGREFTQGDYRGDHINIYSFSDQAELQTVLIHELGHALGIEHVSEPTAFMYYLLGEQSAYGALTVEDVTAFTAVCSRQSRLADIPQPWQKILIWLNV